MRAWKELCTLFTDRSVPYNTVEWNSNSRVVGKLIVRVHASSNIGDALPRPTPDSQFHAHFQAPQHCSLFYPVRTQGPEVGSCRPRTAGSNMSYLEVFV
jgi:hypothetical protein